MSEALAAAPGNSAGADLRAVLFLVFRLGEDRYALDAQRIVEVLPLVQVKRLPRAPEGIAGVCDYRGAPVPVIDLSELAVGRPAQQRLSTRIVLVRYGSDAGRLLGLVAERATETVRRRPSDFVDSGVATRAAPYLGPVTQDARGFIQRIEVERLLSPAVREALDRALGESA